MGITHSLGPIVSSGKHSRDSSGLRSVTMVTDLSTRVYPAPENETGGRPLEERTNHTQDGGRTPLLKAEIALHKSNCPGFCGLSGREPDDFAIAYVTPQAEIGRALQVLELMSCADVA